MDIITAETRVQFENSKACVAFEYEFENEGNINSAVIELNGRYPDNGFAINAVCKEIVYVIEGHGKVYAADTEYQLQLGDMLRILPKEKYYFDGNMKLLISSSPAWNPAQYQNIQ